jgi:hypothetical protein
MDILNPFSPVRIERDERLWVDAALAEYKLGALSRLSAVYAPSHTAGESSPGFRWHGNLAASDFSLMAGRFAGDRIVGADLASQIGGAGLRAELTHTDPDVERPFWRALVAVDYALANAVVDGRALLQRCWSDRTQDYDFKSSSPARSRALRALPRRVWVMNHTASEVEQLRRRESTRRQLVPVADVDVFDGQ